MKQHGISAQAIAEYLQQHPAVDQVYYPGLVTHHNHKVAARQATGFGGMVSFTLKEDTIEAATAFVTSTHLFKLAESLGGVKSLCCHPATMTHKSIPLEIRRKSGVADSLIRLSVGIEETEDLIEDVKETFKRIYEKTTVRLN